MVPDNWQTLKAHKLSESFRLMSSEEFTSLKEDIRIHGMKEPIVLFEGQVLDGRNRHRACAELAMEGVTVAGLSFKTFPGTYEEAEAEAVSKNFMRRHLTKSEKAMFLVLNGFIQLPGEDGQRRQRGTGRDAIMKVGKKYGVNHMTLYKAAYIFAKDRALAQEVADGKKSVPLAEKELRSRAKPEPRRSLPEVIIAAEEFRLIDDALMNIAKSIDRLSNTKQLSKLTSAELLKRIQEFRAFLEGKLVY